MPDPAHGDTRRLSALIRDGLGQAAIPTAASRDVDTLSIELSAAPGASYDDLAPEIVAAIARALGETE